MANEALPSYLASARPNPMDKRGPWYANIAPSYGGIFLWIKLPDNVDTAKLYQSALAAGVAINPGPEWSVNKPHSHSRMRLCFASPTAQEIKEGIAILAEVCRKEFGVPARSANVEAR